MLQHVDMKHLKEKCDIDDKDELQQITAERTTIKKSKPVFVTCNQTFAMQNWLKNLSKKSTLSSRKIIVAKYSEIKMQQTIMFTKYGNQPGMKAAKKTRLKRTKKTVL